MRLPVVFTFALILSACGGRGGGSSSSGGGTASPSPTPSPSSTPSPSLERPSNLTCIPPEPEVVPGTIGTVEAFPSLPPVSSTVGLVQPLNSPDFWYLITREGTVYHFDDDSSADSLSTALDLTSRITTGFNEYGLTGLAIHPNFPSDNRVFALYNDNRNASRSTLSSFTVNTSTRAIDINSETVLLTLNQSIPFHNGGGVAIGGDGYLYASFGDNDSPNDAQNNTNLYGTIIRLDVSGTSYTIPSDNPFAGQSLCNSSANSTGQNCPEIFAYGFRNPWRISVDQETNSVWVGDVGEESFEEVNRIALDGNYGWPAMEGNSCTVSGCDTSGYQPPTSFYAHNGSASVIGGYVYRGTQSPTLSGQYIFGDYTGSRFFQIEEGATAPTTPTPLFPGGITTGDTYAMAQGSDGEVYILRASPANDGELILRITDDSVATYSMPSNLSETGCFNPVTQTSAQGVVEYDNINPLWSDGAAKQRGLAIPDDTYISVLSDGEFRLPENTVLIKHFLTSTSFIETRLLVKHPGGWQGYSYEWNGSQTEAVLLSEGKQENVVEFIHTFPSPSQCGQCHIGNDANLGVESLQLNRDYAPLESNILDYLNDAGYFAEAIDSATQPRLVALDDETATLEEQARSYLHSNCSGCHRPDTGNPTLMDLTYGTPLADTNTCNVPASSDLGVTGAQRIAPGNPDASVVLLRMESLDSGVRMPPLATLIEDTEATQVVRDWINSLSSCD